MKTTPNPDAVEAALRAAVIATREYVLGFCSRHLQSEVFDHLRHPAVEAAMVAAVVGGDGVRAALAAEAQRPQPAPLTDEQLLNCIRAAGVGPVPMGMTRDRGPYEVTEPTLFARRFAEGVLAAHQHPHASGDAPTPFAAQRVADLVSRLRDNSGGHINGLYDREAADALEELAALADSEGSRAVQYLRRARKAEAALTAGGSEAQPVAVIRTWLKNGDRHAELWDWRDGLEALAEGEHLLYAAPQAAAQATGARAMANRIAAIARGLTYNDSPREASAKALLLELVSELGGTGLAAAPQAAEPVPTKPLTKDEIDLILADSFLAANGSVYSTRVYDFVRAVEREHGIGGA